MALDLFQQGWFISHSGIPLTWKVDCDSLSDQEIALFAEIIYANVQMLSKVEGIPTGGLRLANALNKWKYTKGPLLIVDDVLTTGRSMEEQRNGREAIGYVIFSRGLRPEWINCVWEQREYLT